MPSKIEHYWIERLREVAKDNESAGALRVEKALKSIASQEGRTDIPSRRWIGTQLKAFRALPTKQKESYGRFTWPGSMLDGLLPWEASRVGLELWKAYRNVGADPPTVNRVRWNWRLSFAVPDMEPLRRDLEVTSILFADDRTFERLERRLAFEPWEDAAHRLAYNKAFPDDRWEVDDATDK